jgi:hypothetical protein
MLDELGTATLGRLQRLRARRMRAGRRLHAPDEDVAQIVVVGKVERARQPDHRRRCDVGAPRDLAHRANGDLVRIVDDEARRALQARREVGVAPGDGRQRGGWRHQ